MKFYNGYHVEGEAPLGYTCSSQTDGSLEDSLKTMSRHHQSTIESIESNCPGSDFTVKSIMRQGDSQWDTTQD